MPLGVCNTMFCNTKANNAIGGLCIAASFSKNGKPTMPSVVCSWYVNPAFGLCTVRILCWKWSTYHQRYHRWQCHYSHYLFTSIHKQCLNRKKGRSSMLEIPAPRRHQAKEEVYHSRRDERGICQKKATLTTTTQGAFADHHDCHRWMRSDTQSKIR